MFPSSSSSSSPSLVFQNFPREIHSRRLLLHNPLYKSSPDTAAAPPGTASGSSPSEAYLGEGSFDANVVMVLSVLLCALICALGLNSIIRCALRCSTRVATESSSNSANQQANTGVKRKALKTFPVIAYTAELKLPCLDTECVICLSEFAPGERVRVLPKCNHGFHIRCIDKWLMSHSSCPTCRHCLIDTCNKIVGASQPSLSESPSAPSPSRPSPPPPPSAPSPAPSPPPPPSRMLSPPPPTLVLEGGLVPLEPEGVIRNYHSIC